VVEDGRGSIRLQKKSGDKREINQTETKSSKKRRRKNREIFRGERGSSGKKKGHPVSSFGHSPRTESPVEWPDTSRRISNAERRSLREKRGNRPMERVTRRPSNSTGIDKRRRIKSFFGSPP